MAKHLADHRATSQGGRLRNFLRIAHDRSETMWQGLFRRDVARPAANRRVVEYVRIERIRQE